MTERLPLLPDAPGPVREPDRYQEAIASRYAAGDSLGELELDYDHRRDLVERAIRVTLAYLLDQHVNMNEQVDALTGRVGGGAGVG